MPRTARVKGLPSLSPDLPSPRAPTKRSADSMTGKAKAAEGSTDAEQPPTKKSKATAATNKQAHPEPREGPSRSTSRRRRAKHGADTRNEKKSALPNGEGADARPNDRFKTKDACPERGLRDPHDADEAGEEMAAHVEENKRRVAQKSTLSHSHARILELEAELKKVNYERDQAVFVARGVDILERERRDQKYAQLDERYRRQLRRNDTIGAELEKQVWEVDRLTKKAASLEQQIQALEKHHIAELGMEKERTRRAVSEADYWRADAEHNQGLMRTMEEDFNDLSRLETENRARSQREYERKDTLPPAYGGLDDENRVSRVEGAEDGGKLEVAVFKRTIRQNFNKTVMKAEELFNNVTRENTDIAYGRGAYSEPYMAITMFLQETSRNIDDILRRSSDVFTACIRACAGSPSNQNAAAIHRGLARQEYVADRAAKLLIDISLRVLAALEVRPAMLATLSPEQQADAALSWTTVDESLLKAFRMLFNKGPSDNPTLLDVDEKLLTMQYYVMQLQMLRSRINSSSATMVRVGHVSRRVADGRQFDQSREWLTEQIETERMIAANFGEPDSEPDSEPEIPATHPAPAPPHAPVEPVRPSQDVLGNRPAAQAAPQPRGELAAEERRQTPRNQVVAESQGNTTASRPGMSMAAYFAAQERMRAAQAGESSRQHQSESRPSQQATRVAGRSNISTTRYAIADDLSHMSDVLDARDETSASSANPFTAVLRDRPQWLGGPLAEAAKADQRGYDEAQEDDDEESDDQEETVEDRVRYREGSEISSEPDYESPDGMDDSED